MDAISVNEFLKDYKSGKKTFKGDYWLPTIENGKLDGNTFERLIFLKVNLSKSVSMKSVVISNSELKELSAADINWNKSVFKKTKFLKSNLERTSLKEVLFENCIIEKSDFSGADL